MIGKDIYDVPVQPRICNRLLKYVHVYAWLFAFFVACFLSVQSVSAAETSEYFWVKDDGSDKRLYTFDLPEKFKPDFVARFYGSSVYYVRTDAVHPCFFKNGVFVSYLEVSNSGSLAKASINTSYNFSFSENGAGVGSGTWLNGFAGASDISLPLFSDYASAKSYVDTGKVSDSSKVTLPDGYYVDNNGNIQEPKYSKNMGYPATFYFNFIEGSLTYPFKLEWANKDDTLGYDCEIFFEMTYQTKDSVFGKWRDETERLCNSFYVDMTSKKASYSTEENEFSSYNSSLLVEALKRGYCKPISRTAYIRYVNKERSKYGPWVKAYQNQKTGAFGGDDESGSVVTDEDGNVIDTPEYGSGLDTTDIVGKNESLFAPILELFKNFFSKVSSLFSTFFGGIANLTTSIGNVPVLFSKLFSFLPPEVWGILSLGISALIMLRIFGR